MMDNKADVRDLARAARDGDRDALEALVERARPWLFTTAYSHLRHYQNAQDAVSSALLLICLCIDDLRDEAHVRGWMERIVRNEALKLLKRDPAIVDLPDNVPFPCDSPHIQVLKLDIDRALRLLPKDNARTIALFYLGGVSINEIARRTQRPVGTVKRWLHEGRRRLADELEEYAPMKPKLTATIFCTDLSADAVDGMRRDLLDAGFGKVRVLAEMPELSRAGEGDAVEFHLSAAIADTRFAVFDEQVGGRSAFELHTILKAAAEFREMASGILLSHPSNTTIFAAWAAGFDLCLSYESLVNGEFRDFCARIRQQIEGDAFA